MKTLIKSSVLLALLGLNAAAKAQTCESKSIKPGGIIYSVGIESGISTVSFNRSHNWNLGGSLQADFPISGDLYVTANAGYNHFFGKDNAADINLIPVKAGIKYFPLNIAYVKGDASAAFAANKSDAGYEKTAAYIYAPQAGVSCLS